MKIVIDDMGLKKALEKILEHSEPFSEEELRSIKVPLRIEGARNIEQIDYCPNLEFLEIFASDIRNLEAIKGLKNLKTLIVLCTPLENLDAIQHISSIERIEISFSFVTAA